MEPTRSFRGTEPILVRVASRPRAALADAALRYDSDDIPSSEIIDYINVLSQDPVIREALAVSSRHLSSTIKKISSGGEISPRRLLSAAVSLTRYALRITGRPTPFGLNAGVARASIGQTAQASFPGVGTKLVRPDSGWCNELRKTLLRHTEVRHETEVVMNDLCFTRGTRLVLPYVTEAAEEERIGKARKTGNELSVRNTAVIAFVRKEARNPVRYANLLRGILETFPHADEEKIDALLSDLIHSEILLTSLPHASIDSDFIRVAIKSLADSSPLGTSLREVQRALDEYAEQEVGGGTPAWEDLETSGRSVVPQRFHTTAQVDLRAHAEITLPQAVVREVESYATALWRISPLEQAYSSLHEYYEAFVEKYGTGRTVRLPELIDAHSGLGFPRGYLNPRVSHSARLALHERSTSGRDEDRRLLLMGEVFHQATVSSERELIVDKSLIDMLAEEDPQTVPPHSLELCFQLLASSTERIDAGDFQLLASPLVGSPTAGAAMGRFAHMLGITDEVARSVDRSEGFGIPAAVTFQPRTPRMLNVAQVPGVLPFEIPIGHFPHDARKSIDWRDLLVLADDRGLRVVWSKTGEEIHPVAPHLLTLETEAPNLARFLHEIRYTAERRIWQPWNWGRYRFHPVLPRVRVGKVIASPLSWRPSQALIASANNSFDWEHCIANWRRDLNVSDQVRISVQDKVYELDLRDRFHREILRRDMAKTAVTISEDPRNFGGSYGWSDGRSNEIIFPLFGNFREKHTPITKIVDTVMSEQIVHSLDSEWIYLQISAVPEAHDDLIRELNRFIQAVDQNVTGWFFMRYFSPEPHIRLRLRTKSRELRATVWECLTDFLATLRDRGLSRGFSHCEYEPEVGRYGGTEALRLTESVFCVDSQIVLAELARAAELNGRLGQPVLMVANYAALLDSLGPWEWASWAGATFPKATGRSVTRDVIRAAAEIAVPGRAAALLEEATGIVGIHGLWTQQAEVRELGALLCEGPMTAARTGRRDVALNSLLHMQHNRLIGADRESERRSLTLLGHVARLHLDRARNGV
ncbi:lantibiotic dehydratase [Streptomyces sp. BPTC-684]|uniref:lantibiotic dehydratase n=1 Tax=Streptomyces sp. BPTC-684 TaxID=3043734 RepID=UPI0024B06280|nr:lantibiotic dehydratase [Streptomyces sp. BPTC-684]WHM36805.1 lantibiotic dehydratase [Streptomyces sp. BPTC-684]